MNIARSSRSAILLPNGKILVAGGEVQKPKGTLGFTNTARYTP
jgi:hypothetical protein